MRFKDRLYEKLNEYIDRPKAFPELAYAGYKEYPSRSHYHSLEQKKKRTAKLRESIASRKQKINVMRREHRINCVTVLKHLVHSFDLLTRQCLMVAPRYKRARPLYIDEISRKCEMPVRTVQNCLQSLAISGYIQRHKDTLANMMGVARHKLEKNDLKHRIYLTTNFFRAFKCNLSLAFLTQKIAGLGKKGKFKKPAPVKPIPNNPPADPALPTDHPSHNLFQSSAPRKAGDRTVGLETIKALRKSLKPPD